MMMRLFSFSLTIAAGIIATGCGSSDPKLSELSARLFGRPLPGAQEIAQHAKALRIDAHLGIDTALGVYVRQVYSDERFSLARSSSLLSKPESRNHLYEIRYLDRPYCESELRMTGDILLAHLPTEGDKISDKEVDSEQALNQVHMELSSRSLAEQKPEIISQRSCWISSGGTTHNAHDMVVSSEGLEYRAIVSADKVLRLEALFFDVTGSARVYDTNPVTGSLATFSLPDLTGDGSLENDYFTTTSADTKAKSNSHNFVYDPSDGRFDETSMFVHVNEQLVWFQEHGYKWSSKDKLNLYVHAVISGSINNALYTPAFGTTPAKIQVGDGDGIRLKNLPKDSDVVAHEFGHHVVYDNIKAVRGESLVLHEGLADYFAFARTGDPCLGESICPAGSPLRCEIESQCLRTADNDYVLDSNTKPEPHFKSQFISGMLWDLRSDSVPAAKLDRIVLDGVGMILSESGYHDFVLGMLLADDKLNNGKYCSAIYDAAIARGLKNFISDFGCDSSLPKLASFDNAGGTTTTGVTTTTKKSGGESDPFGGCGTIGRGQDATIAQYLLSILLLALGMFAPFIPRRVFPKF
jgi:hypothetical protein